MRRRGGRDGQTQVVKPVAVDDTRTYNEPVQEHTEYSINDINLEYRHLQEYFENKFEINSI